MKYQPGFRILHYFLAEWAIAPTDYGLAQSFYLIANRPAKS